jgi:hypothetical protein
MIPIFSAHNHKKGYEGAFGWYHRDTETIVIHDTYVVQCTL